MNSHPLQISLSLLFIFHWSLVILNLELPVANWKEFCGALKHLKQWIFITENFRKENT